MQKKAIFFVRNFIVGGVERVLVSAVNTLSKNGWKITIVWTGMVEKNHIWQTISPDVQQIYASEIWHLKLSEKPQNFCSKFLWNLRSKLVIWLNRYIAKHIPDFHTYDYVIDFKNGSSLLYNIPLHAHQKRIVWMHGAFSGFQKKKKFQHKKLFSYDKIVCLTEDFKNQFLQYYPKYASKIYQIYNPFDLSLPPINQNEEQQIKKMQPYFVHVSRIDTDKDINTLLLGYEKFITDTKSKTKLVLIGDGKQKNHFQKMCQEKGLDKQIIFYGTSQFPYQWMQNAKALILSSYKEGLGNVLIEAQISNCLAISSDCPEGPKEILKAGQAGILYPTGDYNCLASILSDVDSQNFNKEKYILCAQQNLYRFSSEEFIKKFNQLGM